MLIALALSLSTLTLAAAAYRRWRLRTTLARIGPGQMVVYNTIARSRRW
jgi:hypothetical protein